MRQRCLTSPVGQNHLWGALGLVIVGKVRSGSSQPVSHSRYPPGTQLPPGMLCLVVPILIFAGLVATRI